MKTFLSSILLFFLFSVNQLFAQESASFANSWISYGKPYVKIGITAKGIYKVPFASLPAGFSTVQPSNLQLWHRGKQVAILSTDNNEILFFGVPNDGSSDSVFYQPTSSRLNPYFSMYSDESSYFLTNGETAGLRAEVINKPADTSIPVQTYFRKTNLNVFKDVYSMTTEDPNAPNLRNSFFEFSASKTGPAIIDGKTAAYPFELSGIKKNELEKATVKLLLHGRSSNSRSIEISVGKNEQSLRLVKSLSSAGFGATEYTFELEEGDTDENGKGIFTFKSGSTEDKLKRFSLTYFRISYPASTAIQGKTSYFDLPAVSEPFSRISLSGNFANAKFLDITDPDKPRIIMGKADNLVISRTSGKMANMLVTDETSIVNPAKISNVQFNKQDVNSINYIIVSSENLLQGANSYAAYRSSVNGGSFKTAVVNIKDIYNQFNYGEPSPVAIRNFVNFALSSGLKDKYLLLLGKSVTHNERMVRELPDEVPTVGYPASDILLVEGLAGAPKNVQAIPVGRVSAITNQNVLDYLQKVKDYESNISGEYGWRKEVLHLNGGKSTEEITQLKNELASLEPFVINGSIGGKVTPFAKQQAMAEVESVNITSQVNEGVGLITYFGHGSTIRTDLNMGYITDGDRGYNNAGKYPMMYFNGCGVGNIFSARFNPNPNASDRYALSLDWLLAKNRGSVAIVANSFESFVSPSAKYLQVLYEKMFSDPATVNLSIGKILTAVANQVLTSDNGVYAIANIHQSILQGDPALKLITVSKPDYSLDVNNSIKIYSKSPDKTIGSSDTLKLQIGIFNQGRFLKDDKLPVKITFHFKEGTSSQIETIAAFPYQSTLDIVFPNKNQNIQRVEVQLDPDNILDELNEKNNLAELEINWEIAENEMLYPVETIKDIIPPLLNVKVNNRMIRNEEVLLQNPLLNITVNDDRLIVGDTALVDIFIKPCWNGNCEFEPVNYTAGKYDIQSLTARSFQINYYFDNLVIGKYELLINVRDQSGNSSLQPYRIRFEISEEVSQWSVTSSPNPSSSYIRFEAKTVDFEQIESLEYSVYNLKGIKVGEKIIDKVQADVNEWYWQPDNQPSGLYIYKVTRKGKDSTSKQLTGRILIVK
ncbi:putative type IX secretion system sortase PorU2 [Dyadobacter sediminis]|uniref:Gingipain domain-containing protein n=1 Tax=Dyadobacter sediminis TaxID=1493691 RepID=A0A5R9K904_9BACT|nr:C25 family cysteine peptidase [Dyadobacter sediminis]TLU90579.1 hypothetical protein FEM55_18665 [Dyadobacter sediminis]